MMKSKCYKCLHKREVPGNTHVMCAKPDPQMTGETRAIKMGWFFYPLLFDPTWMTKECSNFESNCDCCASQQTEQRMLKTREMDINAQDPSLEGHEM